MGSHSIPYFATHVFGVFKTSGVKTDGPFRDDGASLMHSCLSGSGPDIRD